MKKEEKIQKDQVERQVKDVRIILDHLLILHDKFYGSRELSLAKTKIQEGSMWLGRVLGFVGATYPYPESYNTANTIIEDRTDQAKDAGFELPQIPKDANSTIAVKWFREQLSLVIKNLKALHDRVTNEMDNGSQGLGSYSVLAIEDLDMANMWFGMELNNIFKWLDQKRGDELRLAKHAYTEYGRVTDFKNFQGNPMPEFEELPEKIQEAWAAAGIAAQCYGGQNTNGAAKFQN